MGQESEWRRSFDEFVGLFGGQFSRSESRESFKQYLRGLLSFAPRKNSWHLAEQAGLKRPDALQRLLYQAAWDADALARQLREVVRMCVGYDPGVGVLDESCFEKKGDKSAGVAKQYCGRLGKVENCQVGVFLGYVTPHGHVLLDRELYLPEGWCEDEERLKAAQVPETVAFQTKPQLAQQLLARVWAEDFPMQWVVADTVYGNSPPLRQFIHEQGRTYVMGIPASRHLVLNDAFPQSADEIAQQVLPADWVQAGVPSEKGWMLYEWAAVRVTVPHDVAETQWLLIRRTLNEAEDTKFFLSNATESTPLSDLAHVALARVHIEQLFEEAKSELGMADYEVRYWHSWYRHMTLVMLAHAWISLIQLTNAQKKPPSPFLGLSLASPMSNDG